MLQYNAPAYFYWTAIGDMGTHTSVSRNQTENEEKWSNRTIEHYAYDDVWILQRVYSFQFYLSFGH